MKNGELGFHAIVVIDANHAGLIVAMKDTGSCSKLGGKGYNDLL